MVARRPNSLFARFATLEAAGSTFETRLSTRFAWRFGLRGCMGADLSHDGTRFRLVYTNVKYWAKDAPFSDTLNFMVTAERITGPWSDPVFLNSSGFDPSLFHDDLHHGGTGQEWLLNMRRDHRLDRNVFSGILLQEFDPEQAALVGLPTLIFKGTSLGVTEGPHLYKRNWNGAWWYYLVVAEGGTDTSMQ